MRAVVQREFGPPEVLRVEASPSPAVGPGEVLIDVEFVNTTFIETRLRAGHAPRPEMLPRLPEVPGNGVGGVVCEVGPGSDRRLRGRRVIASTGGAGAYAERARADVEAVVEIPEQLATDTAVALLADGRTALALMRSAAVQAGETVLVEAAGGGVGSLLVQLARGAGAHVIAAAGAPAKLELARDLGAAITIDYSDPGWSAALEPVDVVFDGVGGEIGAAAFALLRAGGRFCAFGGASGAFAPIDPARAATLGVSILRGSGASAAESSALTRSALELACAGALRPTIGRRFPLERAADAHAAIEARNTLGKTLLLTA